MKSTKLMNNQVIFAVDNGNDIHHLAKFARYLDTVRVNRNLAFKPKVCTGKWKEELEVSYCMDYNDFMEYVANTEWVEHQECFMVVNPVNPRQQHRKQASLLYRCGNTERMGEYKQVTPEEALAKGTFTYFNDDKTYWSAQ